MEEGGVGRSIDVRAEAGTCGVESTGAGGLETKGRGVWYFIEASIRNGGTLIVRTLFVDNFRSWYAFRLGFIYFSNESTPTSKSIVRLLIVVKASVRNALVIRASH